MHAHDFAAGDERSSRDTKVIAAANKQRAANKAEWLKRAKAADKAGDKTLAANLRHQAEIC
jgi:hypothetical protein